jgi:RND family efflux transporter MFP subunit
MFRKSYLLRLAALSLVTVAGCKKPTPPAALVPTVQVEAATMISDDGGRRYSLSLLPFRQAELAFKSSGIVDQIREIRGADGRMREVTMGDPALAGSQLARVRALDYQQKIDAAKGALDQAIASLASAKASEELARANFERAANLYQEASMTKQNYDQALQQRDAANAAVQQAEAGVATAKANLAQARLALHDASILSPFDAVVVSRQVELGNMVTASTTAFTVADIHALKADFTVPDTALSEVEKGRKLSILLPNSQQPVPAIITAVSPSADPQSRVFTVEVTIDNSQRLFKPGMIGSLELKREQGGAKYLTVPLSALARDKSTGGFAVYTPRIEGGMTRVVAQSVTIGKSAGDNVEVLSGLSAGQKVVISGAQTLHNNDVVRVLE